jgi:hypothetical protein
VPSIYLVSGKGHGTPCPYTIPAGVRRPYFENPGL